MNLLDNKPGSALMSRAGNESQLMRSASFTGASGGAGGGSAAAGSTLTLATILRALRRRWPSAISAGVMAATMGVSLVVLLLPAKYVSSGAVQVITKTPRPLFRESGETEDPNIFKHSLAARVKSPMVLMAALKDMDPGLGREFTVKTLELALKTDFLLGPETLRLTLSGEDPQEVATVINRIMDAFIDESRQEELKRWRLTMETLDAIRTKKENEYRRKKNQLIKEEQDRGLLPDAEVMKLYHEAQADVTFRTRERIRAFLDVSRLETEYKGLVEKEKSVDKDTFNVPALDRYILEEIARTPQGLNLLSHKKVLVERMIYEANPNPAALELLESQINALRQKIRPEAEKRWRDEVVQLINIKKAELKDKINAANVDLDYLDKEVRRAEEKAQALNPTLRRLPPAIEALRDDVIREEAALAELGKTDALMRVEPPPGPRVKEWSRAEVSPTRDYSRQIKFGAASAVALFILGLFGVGYVEHRSGRVSVPDEVAQALGMPVVGTLPPVSARARGLTDAGEVSAVQGRLMEAVDSIRTFLVHASRIDKVHVVMVTSAGVGEGKTSLASQLAASLARGWRKTLLIDGDLRHPATHTLFKMGLEPGFSEVLRGEASPEEAIKPTTLSRLWLMPAGRCDAHAVQALAQDNVRALFDNLRQQYEFIIIDSCPVLPVADALSLGQHVDGVLYAMLRDVSRIPAVKAAHMRLANLDVRTLGTVLIGTDSDTGNPGTRYAMLEGSLK